MHPHLGHPDNLHKPANILCKSNTTIRNLFHYHLLDHVSPCLCPLFASTPSNQHGFRSGLHCHQQSQCNRWRSPIHQGHRSRLQQENTRICHRFHMENLPAI
ncbi:hypothetical protein NC651_003038 [Populus alba x Populus x berolinensis]|nr:hypothetical protein NC651_003038 [Populus alba x Populus x berolinensis]